MSIFLIYLGKDEDKNMAGGNGYGNMHIYPTFQETKEYTSITPHIKNEK